MKSLKTAIIILAAISINFALFSCNKEAKGNEKIKNTAEMHGQESQKKIELKVAKKKLSAEEKAEQQERVVEQPVKKHGYASQKDPFGKQIKKVEKSKDEGKVIIITGKLTRTKGAQPMVAGKILDSDYVKDKGHKNWKPEFEKMYGKQVEVKGKLKTHYCNPMEQCLSGGKIEFLKEIQYIKLKK